MIVPAWMLASAGIEKEVVITGVTNRLDVWARDTWARVNEELAKTVREIRPALGNTA